jgi:hypothetical protein
LAANIEEPDESSGAGDTTILHETAEVSEKKHNIAPWFPQTPF